MTGYYSCIQFCPDAGRAECANVGVILFCPDAKFLDSRDAKCGRRIQEFFQMNIEDALCVNAAVAATVDRLDSCWTREHLEHFIATRANDIILTPLRPMRVTDPSKDLDRLYRELVKWPPSGEKP